MFRFNKLAGSAGYSCIRFLDIVRLHVSTLGRSAFAASVNPVIFSAYIRAGESLLAAACIRISVRHLSTSIFTGSGQWSAFNTGFAGSKSVYALAGQCLLARHAQRHLIMPLFSTCFV